MADDERPAVGTVAQEAARLLDALGGWASTTHAGYAAAAGGGRTSPDDAGPHRDRDPDGDSASDASGGKSPRCESCGAENGAGQAVTCQLCPVCQGIGLLRSVRPETVDRLADLAGALAATLRDIAGQRRTEDGAAAPGRTSGRTSGKASEKSASGPRGRVQDIVVDDEDEHHADEHHGDEHHRTGGSATS